MSNCPRCNNSLSYQEQYQQWYCYTCKAYQQPAPQQQPQYQQPPPQAYPPQYGPRYEHADIVARFVAIVIDIIILYIPLGIIWVLLWLAGGIAIGAGGIIGFGGFTAVALGMSLVTFLIQIIYFTVLEGGPKGATFGKRVMGLKVVNEQYQPIDMGTAFIRNILRWIPFISGIIFIIDAIMILVRDDHQSLRDVLAHTYVIKEQTATQNYYPPVPQQQQPYQQPQYQQPPPQQPPQGQYPPPPPGQ